MIDYMMHTLHAEHEALSGQLPSSSLTPFSDQYIGLQTLYIRTYQALTHTEAPALTDQVPIGGILGSALGWVGLELNWRAPSEKPLAIQDTPSAAIEDGFKDGGGGIA